VSLAYIRRRRWFSEHLVFATHFATINFVAGIALMPAQMLEPRLGPVPVMVLGPLALLLLWIYLAVALIRVYGTARWWSPVTALGLILGLSVAQLVTGLLALGVTAVALLYL
jgi:predicted acyltransferase